MSLLNRAIAGTLPLLPRAVIEPFARPYIAGETVADLVREAEALNRQGYLVATSQLGEFVTDRAEAEGATEVYRQLLDEVHERRLAAYVHVKVTQLGLMIDRGFCRDQIQLTSGARGRKTGAPSCAWTWRTARGSTRRWISTVNFIPGFRTSGWSCRPGCAAASTTRGNSRRCGPTSASARASIWSPRRSPTPSRRRSGITTWPCFASCCPPGATSASPPMTTGSLTRPPVWFEELGLSAEQYEFQMLHGVRPQLREAVKQAGHRVRVGVPFGPDWMPYSLRRLRKNPEIARHVLRAVFSKG